MKKNSFVVRNRAFFLVITLCSAVILSCKESASDLVKPKTIADVIMSEDQFSILREIIIGTKMEDALRSEDLTLFAPNNAAFLKSNSSAAKVLGMPSDSAIWFVNHHILQSIKRFSDLKTEKLIAINKDTLSVIKGADSTITVNGASIVTKDVNADNGIIQVVDKLLAY